MTHLESSAGKYQLLWAFFPYLWVGIHNSTTRDRWLSTSTQRLPTDKPDKVTAIRSISNKESNSWYLSGIAYANSCARTYFNGLLAAIAVALLWSEKSDFKSMNTQEKECKKSSIFSKLSNESGSLACSRMPFLRSVKLSSLVLPKNFSSKSTSKES